MISRLTYILHVSPETDLLEKMLDLDPERRLSAADCLAHPYLEEYQDSDPDPPAEKYDDSFESLNLAIPEWKSKCYTV